MSSTSPMTPLFGPGQLSDPTAPAGCRSKNCVPWCFAYGINRASVGVYEFNASQVRAASRTSCTPGVTTPTGGVGYLSAINGTVYLTGGKIRPVLRQLTKAMLWTYLRAGSGVIVSILYDEMIGTRCACEDGFDGGHAMYLNAGRTVNGVNRVQVGDPLADGRRGYRKGFGWCDFDLLARAALDRTGDPDDDSRAGIIAVTFPDTEGVYKRATGRVPVKAAPDPASATLATLVPGKRYYVKRTVTGRPNGIDGKKGWHVIRREADGSDGYVRGDGLEIVAA